MYRYMDSDLNSIIEFYRRVVAGQAGPELSMACPESLERGLLDYSLESLHVIDRYLHCVHAVQDGIPTIAYANTIMGMAIYIGEVIRRGSPSTEYHWGRSALQPTADSPSEVGFGDLTMFVLFSHSVGDAIVPANAVFRLIRRGASAPSIHTFAVNSIRRAWTATPTQ
jgi:hypothetical protein